MFFYVLLCSSMFFYVLLWRCVPSETPFQAAQEQVTRSNWVAVFALITLHTNLTKVKTGLIDKDEFDFESPRYRSTGYFYNRSFIK